MSNPFKDYSAKLREVPRSTPEWLKREKRNARRRENYAMKKHGISREEAASRETHRAESASQSDSDFEG